MSDRGRAQGGGSDADRPRLLGWGTEPRPQRHRSHPAGTRPRRPSSCVDDGGAAGRRLRSAVDTAAAHSSTVILVTHSGARYPTSVLLDRDPTAVARVVYVDSGPSADGSAFDASVPPEQNQVPLPPFEQLRAVSTA